MVFPPNIYLIGAQKSGTTTLAYLLSQHPDLCLSNPKETHFFSHNWDKGIAWYQEKFADDSAVCIDASTTYAMAPLSEPRNSVGFKKCFTSVPQRIYSVNPNAKFIYLLRDPVERTYSGYWHYFARGVETQEFGEAIRSDSFYLDVSNYYGQLSFWLEYFPIESFLFILFEDLRKEPQKVAEECFKFMEVNIEIQVGLQSALNTSRYVNGVGRLANRLFEFADYHDVHVVPSSLKKVVRIRQTIRKLTTNTSKIIPKMIEEDRTFLQEYFYNKNDNLKHLTGLALSQW